MQISRRKITFLLVMLLALVAGIYACGQSKEDSKEAVEEKAEQKEETFYTFVDVKGNSYEAELLEDVPKNPYDYSRLTEKDGFPCYTDEKGDVISRVGIDVSQYQEKVDWKKVKDSGVTFVMIRLGYRGYGEAGKLVEDPLYRSHIEGALKEGLDVGVYFFSQAVSDEEAKEEAAFVQERIKDYKITCPVVFDTEEITFDEARTDTLDSEQFTNNCVVFCDAMEEAGYDTMIYANMKWLAFTLDLTKLTEYDIWYADYASQPQCPYAFSMWQYTEKGKVDGIEGNVDLNIWFDEE